MDFLTNKAGMIEGRPVRVGGSAPLPPAFRPDIVRSVRLRPRLAAGVAAVVLLLVLGYALTRRPVYSVESQVHEEPAAPKMMSDGVGGGSFDTNSYESYMQQQIVMVTRPDVLAAAIASLPATTWRPLGPTQKAAVTTLATQLKVARVTTSYELSIGLQGEDAAKTTDIVNAVTTAYLDAVRKETSGQSDQRAQLLAEERRRIEAEMQSARQEQAGLSASLGVASPLGETANPYDFEIASVRQQLLAAREAHDVSAAQLGAMSGEDATHNKALSAAADELIAGDSGLSTMRASIAGRRSALTGQMAGLKPDNPVYKQDLDELNDLDKTLDGMTTQLRGKAERQLQQKLRSDLERTGDVESRLNAQLGRLTSTASTAAPKLQRAAELSADLERLNTRYAVVDDALRSLQLEANGPGVVRLSLPATVPASPDPSRRFLLVLAAPLLALIFGVTAAVLARKRDGHIYSGRDIEETLGFAPIAVLPARPDVSVRVLDEYVLRLAAGIEGAYRSSGAQTFLLTAVSASTDIRPLRNALTSKLERIGVDVAVARTTDLMVAGLDGTQELAKPGEAGSDGFVSLHLAKLKGAHALVVIDAPSLGTSAETEYVARCADATILVAECGVTTREELLQSAKLLERLNARGIAAVLDGLHLRVADTSFRKAIDAFEQREPERPYRQEPREVAAQEILEAHVAYEAEPVAAADPEPSLEEVPAQPESYPEVVQETVAEELVPVSVAASVVDSDASTVQAPMERSAPLAFRHRGIRESSTLAEAEEELPVPAAREDVSEAVESGPHHVAPSERMAPTLSGRRERTNGDTKMSGSKSWFHRFLHRDDEKVSIIPEKDEDEQADPAAFLTSRISRVMPAQEIAVEQSEPEQAAMEESHETSFSRRFVMEPVHAEPVAAVAEEGADEAQGTTHVAEEALAHVESRDLESAQFLVPQEIIAPWALKTAEPVAAEAVAAEPVPEVHAEPEPVARVRAPRPLSFHELAGPAHVEQAAAIAQTSQAETYAQPYSGAPSAQAAEHSAEPLVAEVLASEPVPVPETIPEPVLEAPGPAPVFEHQPAAAFAEVEPPTLRDPYGTPSGTSRWDPIPELRPTDSGWNRLHGLTAPKPAAPEPAVTQTARHADEWTWTSRAGESAEETPEAADEPALSRPWGLLSRFQQAHLNTPARRPEGTNHEAGRPVQVSRKG